MSQSTMLLPLSSPQEVIYFDQKLHPELPNYNLGIRVELTGNINPALLQQVIDQLVAEQPSIRSIIVEDGEKVFQKILPDLPIELILEDVRAAEAPRAAAEQRLKAELQRAFNTCEQSYRAVLVQLSDTEFTLLIAYHHLFGDGISGSNILDSLFSYYNQLANGERLKIPVSGAYAEFVHDDLRYIQSKRYARSAEYWQKTFQDVPDVLFQEYAPQTTLSPNHVRHLPVKRALYEQLVAQSNALGCSVAHLIITLVAVYFARVKRRDELVIGVPVHNRGKAKYKNVVGMFSSVLPLRLPIHHDQSIADIMLALARRLQESYRHQRFPLAEINRTCRLTALGRSQLFEVTVSVEEFAVDFPFTAGRYHVKRVVNPFDQSPVAITVMDYHKTDDVILELCCHQSVFSEQETRQTGERLLHLLTQCVDGLPQDVSLLTDKERHEAINVWNNTQQPIIEPYLAHQRFEHFAHRQPDAIAVLHQNEHITYAELNKRTNQLARYLLTQGAKPDCFVALYFPRSIDMIVAIIAVLKAGAAYMPIDVNYPRDRIEYMLQDAQPILMLTHRNLASIFSENIAKSVNTVNIDEPDFLALIAGFDSQNLSIDITQVQPNNLAYIIYTSGSTGQPKGVLIEHHSLVNLTCAVQKVYGSTEHDRFTQCASISFDMAVEDIFVALCSGAGLVLRDEDWFNDAHTFWRYCKQFQITITSLTTAFWHVLASDDTPIPTNVRAVSMGGEAVNPERVKQWLEKPGYVPALFNGYGPTETTVSATFEHVKSLADLRSIGRPISNYTAYVLDNQRWPVPVGAEGELYIGGLGVARGYLHRDELTAEVFMDNPFHADSGIHSGRIYKTGDLVKQLPSGQIEYIARVDNQVKIRGFRIELGEVESQLSVCEGVLDNVVIARDEPKRLVAYIVAGEPLENEADAQKSLSVAVKAQLNTVLPDYMVPAVFMFVDQLPLTPNGKIDRKSLPEPDFSSSQQAFVAASTATEVALVAMWNDILHINNIGVHDNFFELGGHSLTATRLVSAVRSHFGIELMVRSIFEHQTVQQLAKIIDAQAQRQQHLDFNDLHSNAISPSIPRLRKISRDHSLTLSFAQQRLWLADQIEPGSKQYLMPGVFYCDGKLDTVVLQQALQTIIERHEVLRTVYRVAENTQPEQVVIPDATLTLQHVDLTHVNPEQQTLQIEQLARQEAQTPFDLANDLLLRVTTIQRTETSYVLLLTKHHIASDGWSVALLTRELATLYTAYLAEQPNPLPELSVQYADYAHWQRHYLQGACLAEQVDFWREYLQGIPTVHSLPLDKPRPEQQTFAGDSFCTLLSASQQARLNQFASQQGVTLFMVIQAAFAALMNRYSGENDIVMGSSIANREQTDVEPLIGFFVNTLLLRSDFSGQPSFESLLAQTKRNLLSAYQYQQIPFEKLVDELQPERNLSHNPLFQIMLTLQNTDADCLDFAGLSLRLARGNRKVARVDLSLDILELGSNKGIELTWEFATDLFERHTIERMAEHFSYLVTHLLEQPQLPVAQSPMISAQEAEHILREFNGPLVEYRGEATIHQRFEARVTETPEAIAVVHDSSHEAGGSLQSLSYAQLNEQANRVAHFLRAQGVKNGELVGIFAARSPQFLVAILGIMKAGAAYVPLDPINPQDRIDTMIANANLNVLFSEFSLKSRFNSERAILWMDIHTFDTSLAQYPTSNLIQNAENASTGNDVAYMIYTSGSTGTPKGALVHHAGALNHIDAEFDVLGFMPTDKSGLMPTNFLQSAASSSDVSVWQFLAPVVSGGKTVILRDMADVENIVLQLQTHNVHLMQAAPVVLQLIVEHVQTLNDSQRQFPALKWMMAIAEALPIPVLNAWLTLYPHIPVMNGYGPSEASDDITEFVLRQPLPETTPSVPIGRPLPNLTMYVLNAQQQLQPIGVPGELCVSGVGVGPGYFNNIDKTRDVFIANPFTGQHGVHGDRLYRTGDLGRWLPDGSLEFMGRIDNQVKVRGFRIELGEVEAAIAQVVGVADVAVVAVKNPQNQNVLVAYMTRKTDAHQNHSKKVQTDDLRTALKEKLPDYMLPASFNWLDKMPLNAADKIDRRRLPAPDFNAEIAARYIAPRNSTEQMLARIWQELLSLKQVGIHDNFFEVGGHSLSATRLASAIRQQFAVDVAVRVVFEHQTIAQLATFVAEAGVSAIPTMIPVEHSQPQPLSFAQQRLWLINQMDPSSAQYLIPYNLRIKGPLNINALTHALDGIVQRHKILRTVYRTDTNDNVQQFICEAHLADIPMADLSSFTTQEQQYAAQRIMDEEVNQGFDLANDVMLRAQFVKWADDDHLLLLTVHHIAFDGWSGGVLAQEVSALYQHFAQASEQASAVQEATLLATALPELPFQYVDFAVWQRSWLQGETLTQQLQFWTDYLAGVPTVHNLPLDYPRPSVQHYDSGAYQHTLPHSLSTQLQKLAKKHDVTLFMLLNAAFSTLLHRYSGDTDIVIGSPIANREQAALESLVGFFVNTLVLRNNFQDNPRFIDLLMRSKQDLLNAYQHQQVPFEKLVEELGVARSLSHNPLVQVLLVLQNTDESELALRSDATSRITISEAPLEAKAVSAGFDLTLDVRESEGQLTLLWGYGTDIFSATTIERMALHFVRLLEGICAQPELPVSQLTMITDQEAAHILTDFNAPTVDYQGEATIHERFEARVAETPNAVAVLLDTRHESSRLSSGVYSADTVNSSGTSRSFDTSCSSNTATLDALSYAQLNNLANQVAHFLLENGVKRGELVAIYAQRTPRFLAVMLGIMKAGAAYVPVDPINPQERVNDMIANAEVRVLFSEAALQATLQSTADLVWMDMQTLGNDVAEYSIQNIVHAQPITGDDLAYMIYTSGSTGMPKGALVHHAGALNHIDAEFDVLGFMADNRPDDKTCLLPKNFLQSAASSSDVSVWQFLSPIVSGGQTVILQDMADVENIIRQLQQHDVHLLQAVPVLLHLLVDYVRVAHPQGCPLPALQWVMSTGDALPVPVANAWLALYPEVPIMNGYGPSEASDDVTEFVVNAQLPHDALNVPIGRPLPNLTMYVMNDQLQLQPIGVPGELCVSGVGVGKGYKNNPEKTDDAFKPNPYAGMHGVHGDRLYRTGDLGRWRPDGTLEFMGRIDNQVKVRGFRIELGEVEAAIAQVDGVADVAVIVVKNAQEQNELAAYMTHEVFTPDDAHDDINSEELRAALKTKLPHYMLPASLTWLAQMPLNPAGKIDRHCLPKPDVTSVLNNSYVAPRDATEHTLVDIWQSLLSLEKVGIYDNFFALGGHSLTATRLASAMRAAFSVEVAVRAVFECQTIAELAELVSSAALSSVPAFEVVDYSIAHPLSFAQQRLWLIHQMYPQSTQYLMPCRLRFEGPLNIDALTEALNALLQRHSVLRTVYRTDDATEVLQQICDAQITHLPLMDLSHLTTDKQHQEAQRILNKAATQPFDLANDVLLRGLLVKLADDDHVMLIMTHHIAFDGWSADILTQEVSTLYQAFSVDNVTQTTQKLLAPLQRQYVDFAVWQRCWLQGEVLDEQLAFWQDYLHDVPTVHNLPLDKPRGNTQHVNGAVLDYALSAELTQQLNQVCQQQSVTLFMLLNAAFATLLHRYSGDTDIVIGSPIANREHADLEPLVGFFVNTLVLRSNFDSNPRFSDLLQQSKQDLLNAYQHQQIPFEKLVEALDVPRSVNHNPLIQVMLVLQNTEQSELSLATEQISNEQTVRVSDVPFDTSTMSTGFDLNLDIEETILDAEDPQLLLSWGYASTLFNRCTIERMNQHFEQLLLSIVADVTQPCAGLNMLADAEKQPLIYQWNDTQIECDNMLCIHERFEYFAATTPDALALTYCDKSLTYAELNQHANQLAHHLIELGIRPSNVTGFGQSPTENDTALVAICVERSLEMIIAMLGIWKAGGAYVPIDPGYPAERIEHIMRDSSAEVLLTQTALVKGLPIADNTHIVRLDNVEQFTHNSSENIPVTSLGLTSQHLAYMIYTSGSTGVPKGSLLHHRGLVNLSGFQQTKLKVTPNSRVLQFAAVAFDGATWEVVMALAAGASLHLLEQADAKDPNAIGAVVRRHQITHATLAPVLLPYFTKADWESCQHFGVAAETCPPSMVKAWSQGRTFFNSYGPSEATVCSTMAYHTAGMSVMPIGLPIQNTQAYVLNDSLQLTPIGVVGELYVSGAHLSYGYLNRPELNAQVFMANPFSTDPTSKLYRTGDLVRRLEDGNLMYIGRADQQVKIRGVRIELSEIEAALLQFDWIAEAVVVARDEPKRLIAYVVPTKGNNTELSPLDTLRENTRDALLTKLPEHMQPAAIMCLAQIPLTRHRKVDRRALPAPEPTSTSAQRYVAPISEVHKKLCLLWQKVLNVNSVGIDDNFFALGGHSLLATQLVILVRQEFHPAVRVRDVFEQQTIRQFARLLEVSSAEPHRTSAVTQPPVKPTKTRSGQSLSFSQKRLWLIDQLQPSNVQYNMPGRVTLDGELSVEALRDAFQQILARHEVLRTTYAMNEQGEPIQVIHQSVAMPFELHDLSAVDEKTAQNRIEELAEQQIFTPFDLSADVMMRAVVVLAPSMGKASFSVLFTMHHIASDGWSMKVLVNELNHFYQSAMGKPVSALPKLPVQYLDYAMWQQEHLQGEAFDAQIEFWKNTLAGIPAVHSLPLDFARPATPSHQGCTVVQQLSRSVSDGLQSLATQHNISLFMVMHAAFSALFHRYSGEDDIVIATAIANREQAEVEHLIGFFVNTLVLRADFSEHPSFDGLLTQSREHIFAAFDHQQVPFDAVVDALQPERNASYNPLFQIILTLHNQAEADLALAGAAEQIDELTVIDADIAETGKILVFPNTDVAKFDITLDVMPSEAGLAVSWNVAKDLFTPETVVRMAEHFERLMQECIAQPQTAIAELSMLCAKETQQLLEPTKQPNVAKMPQYLAREDNCLHQRFAQQALLMPEQTALVFGEQRISYAQLNAKANQLARYLHTQQHITPNTLIGLCVSRSAEMVVGILAILKAGGAYVPIDPSYPQERIDYIMQDSQLSMVLAENAVKEPSHIFAYFVGNVLTLDGVLAANSEHPCCAESTQNLSEQEVNSSADDLAYVIYTSGSTGNPKGVLQTHHNALRLFDATQADFGFNGSDTWCLFHSFAFDFSVWELWGALLYSGKLLIPSFAETRDTDQFVRLCQREQLTVLNQTPSAFEGLTSFLISTEQALPNVRVVVFGGEALSQHHVQQWQQQFTKQSTQLVNMYGITETTVHVTYYPITGEETGAMPIGKPLADQRIVLLNEGLSLVPNGCVGEMYVGGEGLAPGYLQRDELTAECFINNPFTEATNLGKRLYKTGDLAKYNAAGDLVFMGRCDDQVKVRGFRIELGEIEAKLNQCHLIDSSVVLNVPTKAGDNQLVAYVRPNAVTQSDIAWLSQAKQDLARFIPSYMMPTVFIAVEHWPLTANGKINKKALPAVDSAQQHTEYVAPRSATERHLHDIWCAMLRQEQLSIHANFYEVGGNSLLLVRLNVKIKQVLQVDIPLMQLATLQTIAQLAQAIINGIEVQGALVAVTPARQHAQKILLCVPYAGADGLVFQKLADELGDEFAVHSLQFPREFGEQTEDNAALYRYFQHHLASAVESVKALSESSNTAPKQFYLWGHCAGSLPATWFAYLLEQEGIRILDFFVGGSLWEPVQVEKSALDALLNIDFREQLNSLEDVAELLTYAGFDTKNTLSEEEWQVILPKAQKDQLFSSWCLSQYLYQSSHAPLNSTLHCVIAKDDPMTAEYESNWQQWQQVSQDCRLYELAQGGHYFIDNQFVQVAQWINAAVEESDAVSS